jgi:glutamate 5-kinase
MKRQTLETARRVVVKVGTSVVTQPNGTLAVGRLGHLMEQLAALRNHDREVILVTSGAIGVGARRLGLTPSNLQDRQAAATAGQAALMAFYDELGRRLNMPTAQVLLIEADFRSRRRYNNLSANLERLLELRALPIINENDSVSTAGLDPSRIRVFGDNDRLAALVAAGTGADVLLLLTNVEGVRDRPDGQRIPHLTPDDVVSFGPPGRGGTGGMEAKVAAAQIAARAGVATVIASGSTPGVVRDVLAGRDVGTLFEPSPQHNRRRRWLAYATAPTHRVHVNAGAYAALVERGGSLLAVGATQVEGEFLAGAVVAVVAPDGEVFAHGIAGCSSESARAALGQSGHAPLVHRDDIVLLDLSA